jgi:hypothetical protein
MSILPPPPHPRSWRPPPPPPLLYQALADAAHAEQTHAQQAQSESVRAEQEVVEAREELPPDDLLPDPSAVSAARPADGLYDFGDEDLATTPYQSDYPPPNAAELRRSWPIIPPAPLPNLSVEQSPSNYAPSNYAPSNYTPSNNTPPSYTPSNFSQSAYSSWPPSVLEARANLASSINVARTSWERLLEKAKLGVARTAWQGRWFARRARAWLDERWDGIDESQKGWMRAKAPYAAGLVIVATSMFSIGRTFEPTADDDQTTTAAEGSPASSEGNAASQNAVERAPTQARLEGQHRLPAPSLSLPPVPGVSQSPDNEAPILVGLAENLSSEGRDAEAVPVLERALARNPHLTDDPAFLRALKRTALSEDRVAASAAYALLVGPMGERGAEILYELSISPAARRGVRERAAYYVYTKDFEHKAPLPLYAAFKLLSAQTCEAKKSLLPFAAEAGGRHALDYLRELDKRKVCSLDDFDNCYPCMNADEELPDTIAKIETRLGA